MFWQTYIAQDAKEVADAERRRAHMCLLVDVAGESEQDKLRGIEFHVGPPGDWRETGDTRVVLTVREPDPAQSSKLFFWSRPLGTLQNLYHRGRPRDWAFGLERIASVYIFQQRFEGKEWSAEVNSQQFTKDLARQLGLNWPVDLVIGDVCPWATDFALDC